MTKHGIYPGSDWNGSNVGSYALNAADIESHVGRTFALQRFYRTWPDVGISKVEQDMVAKGRTPYVEIAPAARADSNWAVVASGAADAYIHAQAKCYRDWWNTLATKPAPKFYFVFQHEPDTDTGNGTPAEFRAAYKYWTDIWRAEAVPCIYVANQTMSALRASYTKWMPDLSTFDLLGVDGYNKGPVAGAKWRKFEALFQVGHDIAAKLGKPLCIGEVGCAENPNDANGPYSKAQWYTDEGTTLVAWQTVAFVSHTHFPGKADYRVSTSQASAAAFTALGHSAVLSA